MWWFGLVGRGLGTPYGRGRNCVYGRDGCGRPSLHDEVSPIAIDVQYVGCRCKARVKVLERAMTVVEWELHFGRAQKPGMSEMDNESKKWLRERSSEAAWCT